MPRLRISLLGGLKLSYGRGRTVDLAASCRPILGYLLLQRRREVSRQELAGTLWTDVDDHSAHRCLSTALWRLKQTAGLRHDLVQSRSPDSIAFARHVLGWLDIVAFEYRIRPCLDISPSDLDARAVHRLGLALDLYQGDLLPDIQEQWVLVERQHFQTLHREGLYQLTCAHFAARRWSHVLLYGHRLSVLEPLREDVHRLLMCCYAEMGNRAKAIEQYRICQEELSSELGVKPMAETQALCREILPQSTEAGTMAPLAPTGAPPFSLASERIRRARRAIRASDLRLAETLELIGHAQRRPPGPPLSLDSRARTKNFDRYIR
jgi:DNA-binding SARP family transcriptional activator